MTYVGSKASPNFVVCVCAFDWVCIVCDTLKGISYNLKSLPQCDNCPND